MKLFDRLKQFRHAPESAVQSAPPAPGREEASLEDLWFSLCDNPNQEEQLPELLEICGKKGGPAAIRAALEELSGIKGSWLPQLYLGRQALEMDNFPEAREWYLRVLERGTPNDYALLMISADLGRCGFAAEMPDLLAGKYDPDQHNVYIGLNLLQACRDTGRVEEGLALLDEIRRAETPEIREYLNGFEDAFRYSAGKPEESGEVPEDVQEETREDVEPQQEISGTGEEDESAVPSVPKNVILPSRPLMVDIPVWGYGMPALQDLFPSVIDRRRVGVYMYADTTPAGRTATVQGDAITPADLSVSLPLFLGERLFFTTHYAPIALFPVNRKFGPKAEGIEPDVQSLFGLCAKEALDFVITGTICLDRGVYRVRTWILDRSKQNARIVAKDLPMGTFGQAFGDMVSDIMTPFYDKRYIRPSGRSSFQYEMPPSDLVRLQLQAGSLLLYQYLVRQKECDLSVLPDNAKMLGTYASLANADPKNPMYLMMLISGMNHVWKSGSDEYKEFRQILYEVADKNRYSAPVKATVAEINALLTDA